MWYGLMCFVGQCWKKYPSLHIKKRDMDEFINVSHIFINDVSRCIAIFCDLKKKAKSSFIF